MKRETTMPKVSVIILTLNEEINLPNCLESVKDLASEILIVDCGSTDKTKEIAERFGAKVVFHEFKNQAQQFNWALDNLEIHGDWILRLDADEFLTKELMEEIADVLSKTKAEVSGFVMRRRVYFMGRWMKYGGYYPAWFIRLFKKGMGRYEAREVDEHIVISEGIVEKLKNDFVDDNKNNLAWWIEKQNWHSSREVLAVTKTDVGLSLKPSILKGQAERKRWLKENVFMGFPMFLRSFLYFVYRYFLRLGFLDGKEGLIFHFLSAFWYRFLIDAKLFEYKKAVKNQ